MNPFEKLQPQENPREEPKSEKIPEPKTKAEMPEKSIEDFLKEHGIETALDIKIFLTPHGTMTDAEKIQKTLKDADIFVQEIISQKRMEKILQKVADGELTPESARKNYNIPKKSTFHGKLLDLIYKTGKKIIVADISLEDKLGQETRKTIKNLSISNKLKKFPDAKTAAKYIASQTAKSGFQQIERERRIQENLKNKLLYLLQNNKELADKKTLRLLIEMGSAHTTLYHALKKSNPKIELEYVGKPFIFSHVSQIARGIMTGKPINEETKLKALAEILLSPIISVVEKHITTSEQLIAYTRKSVEKFSAKEIEEIFEKFKNENRRKYLDYLEEKFKEKNIPIDKTEAKKNELSTSI